ncbi:MAG TPA: DUF6569 family protein [Pyrinomonadaceae bacterium]|nr:DUF6569 family protein [Pyrinomonadaceae bacterium]
MSSRPGSIRALATLSASALLFAAALILPFANAPARAHGPSIHGPRPVRRQYQVGRPVAYKNLTLYPIHGRVAPPATNDYITLDEGLRAGTVVITERGGEGQMARRQPRQTTRARQQQQVQVSNNVAGGGGASVNELALVNKSGKKLLLLAGEVIVGGKQDRIVEEDLVVPAISVPVSLSVFCVEHGRWSSRNERVSASEGTEMGAPAPGVVAAAPAENFSSLGAISHPKLRAAAQDKKEQGEVWSEVSKNNASLGTSNSTDTYQMVYSSEKVRATMDDYVSALQREVTGADVVGVVVARGGELIWVDQFASPTLFQRYWPKLLKSYVVEALSGPAVERQPTIAEAQRYLDERSGDAKATAKAGVYELTKLENARYAVFELWDISLVKRVRLHFNKMQR